MELRNFFVKCIDNELNNERANDLFKCTTPFENMMKEGTWPTDNEIFGVASLLNTSNFVNTNKNQKS